MTRNTSLPREGSAAPDPSRAFSRGRPRSRPLRRLRLVGLVVPSLLLTALVGVDFFVLEAVLPRFEAHLAFLGAGLAGIVAFSFVIFGRIGELQARIALQNERLVERAQQIAALEERHRIGIELHDGAMQSLYGASFLIEEAAERIDGEPRDAAALFRKAVDRLNATIADLRGYVVGLKPASMSGGSLRESLETMAESARAGSLVDVVVDVDPAAEGALDAHSAETLFSIAADALANVIRHARATRADLSVGLDDHYVALTVADDGVGFDPVAAVDGAGLASMRDRARAASGRFAVDSAPGAGTRVQVSLPVGTLQS